MGCNTTHPHLLRLLAERAVRDHRVALVAREVCPEPPIPRGLVVDLSHAMSTIAAPELGRIRAVRRTRRDRHCRNHHNGDDNGKKQTSCQSFHNAPVRFVCSP